MDCNVIKDLLPLYIDGCCSRESCLLIEEHLKTCPECEKARQSMGKPVQTQPVAQPKSSFHRISDWKASFLQSMMLFVSFAVITLGVILEGRTPNGPSNGLWAVALIVPATGYLLSMAHWFFVRVYKSRKAFSIGSCLVTLGITALGYGWAFVHYAGGIDLTAALLWVGIALSLVFCLLSKVLSDRYALLLGRE